MAHKPVVRRFGSWDIIAMRVSAGRCVEFEVRRSGPHCNSTVRRKSEVVGGADSFVSETGGVLRVISTASIL